MGYKVEQSALQRQQKLETATGLMIKEKMYKDQFPQVDDLTTQISSLYATLEAENYKIDKMRYEITKETEDKTRVMCELEAQNQAREWAVV